MRVLSLMLLGFLLVACAETTDSHYATMGDAQRQGAVSAGWVPDWLPPSATDIREVHDLDTNQFMLAFRFPAKTALTIPAVCRQIDGLSAPLPAFKRKWWPGDVPATPLATHRHVFMQCASYLVAYSSALGEAFVWSFGSI